jgi:hypothetical protein
MQYPDTQFGHFPEPKALEHFGDKVWLLGVQLASLPGLLGAGNVEGHLAMIDLGVVMWLHHHHPRASSVSLCGLSEELRLYLAPSLCPLIFSEHTECWQIKQMTGLTSGAPFAVSW